MRLRFYSRPFAAAAAFLAAGAAGCSNGPAKANIELRKQNQQLAAQVDQLRLQNQALEQQLKANDSRPGATTRQLPEPVLDQLFTVHSLTLGRLTGGYTEDPTKPGDQMLKVYAVPTDDAGEPLKAAGSFTVELFDLAEQGDTRLGKWDFSLDKARADWFGRTFLYTYVLPCPWQKPPQHGDLLARVTFTDALTGRQFAVDQHVSVKPPPGQ